MEHTAHWTYSSKWCVDLTVVSTKSFRHFIAWFYDITDDAAHIDATLIVAISCTTSKQDIQVSSRSTTLFHTGSRAYQASHATDRNYCSSSINSSSANGNTFGLTIAYDTAIGNSTNHAANTDITTPLFHFGRERHATGIHLTSGNLTFNDGSKNTITAGIPFVSIGSRNIAHGESLNLTSDAAEQTAIAVIVVVKRKILHRTAVTIERAGEVSLILLHTISPGFSAKVNNKTFGHHPMTGVIFHHRAEIGESLFRVDDVRVARRTGASDTCIGERGRRITIPRISERRHYSCDKYHSEHQRLSECCKNSVGFLHFSYVRFVILTL